MAKVLVLSATERAGAPAGSPPVRDAELLRVAAEADRIGRHALAPEAGQADLILFAETSGYAGRWFWRLRRHPLLREARDRSFMFCSADRVSPVLPGVFASIPRSSYDPGRMRSGPYLTVRERGRMRFRADAPAIRLFSFLGNAANHPVRREILALENPDAQLEDPAASGAELSADESMRRYTRSLRESLFVVCPRGIGPSSFRLFEAMLMGRAPVIVSDEWVPPEGPDWESFSIRVPEGEVSSIPGLLAERAGDAERMGAAARAAWLEWFAEDVRFDRIVESCLELAGPGA